MEIEKIEFSEIGGRVNTASVFVIEYGDSEHDVVAIISEDDGWITVAKIEGFEFSGLLLLRKEDCQAAGDSERLQFIRNVIENEGVRIPSLRDLDVGRFNLEGWISYLYRSDTIFCVEDLAEGGILIGKITSNQSTHFSINYLAGDGSKWHSDVKVDDIERIHFCGPYESAIGRFAFGDKLLD